MSDFDFDLLNELVDEAPTAGFGPQVNFGKCTMDVVILSWTGDRGSRTKNERKFAKGEVLKNGEYLQITFKVDVTELNPMLTKEYSRRVDVKKSGPRSKTDWSEIVEPSLLSVFGKDWTKRIGKGVYVMVEDAETLQTDENGNPKSFTTQGGKTYTNTVPRFVTVFKSKAECQAAREARFTKRENGSVESTDSDIPSDVTATVRGVINSLGVDGAKDAISNVAPYNQYDWDELVKAANPL